MMWLLFDVVVTVVVHNVVVIVGKCAVMVHTDGVVDCAVAGVGFNVAVGDVGVANVVSICVGLVICVVAVVSVYVYVCVCCAVVFDVCMPVVVVGCYD